MAGNSPTSSPSLDHLFIQTLMSRLQLRPPYLDTNSFLSQTLDDFILPKDTTDDEDDDEDADHDLSRLSNPTSPRRRRLAKEESKLEKELIRIIHTPAALETLKSNSGQSVSIGDHNICVGSHEDPGSEYRVWEWHGHIMFFDGEDGYSPEYIYGNYFERLPENKKKKGEEEEEEEEETKVKAGGNLGLRDLIGVSSDAGLGAGGRVLHRNSLNAGSSLAR